MGKNIRTTRDAVEFFPFNGFVVEMREKGLVVDWEGVYGFWVGFNLKQKFDGVYPVYG